MENSEKYTFTVFIPTFNRAHTLDRALQSIAVQSFRDFEVVIIDDGSTDGTAELVDTWIQDSDFPIVYHWQPNQGKHAAHNAAVKRARGFLLITLDSDDVLVPDALERFRYHWDNIPEDEREQYAGVEGLGTVSGSGKIHGDRFPGDVFDSNWFEIRRTHGIRGDKKNAIRTDLLRKFPYPRLEGEKHIRPSLLLDRLAHNFKVRFFNEVVQIFEFQPDGISSDRFRLRTSNPRGFHYYYREAVNVHDVLDSPRKLFRKHVLYVRYGLHAGIGFIQLFREAKHQLYYLIAVPAGVFKCLTDKLRLKTRESKYPEHKKTGKTVVTHLDENDQTK